MKAIEENGGHKKKCGGAFSYRPPVALEPDLKDLAEVTRRNKTSIISEGLEKILPDLKKQFAPELKALRARRKRGKTS